MDNSKVLKPIVGSQESSESKKKESNKKKKVGILSALALLLSTGTIATSVAIVKANMPKLEIKFDDWFVDSFDFDSMQAFIDEHRLSKGDIDKELPGYVDKKAKDQNVKNADMITNVKLTNKIPETNKLPHGIYVEMSAETEYAFTYQADLSLEENPEQQTKQLTSIAETPKTPRYYISKDRTKLYVLVYERESDSDESLEGDLQTYNDYHITNANEAFNKLEQYISEQSRRYTYQEFSTNENYWKPGLDLFYNTLIGLEHQYIIKDSVKFETDNNGQNVIKITLDAKRSNFYFDDVQNSHNVEYSLNPNNAKEGILTIKGLSYFNDVLLNIDTLQTKIQEYIKEFKPDENIDRRYTLQEFQQQFNAQDLKELILKSLGLLNETPNTLDDTDTENPDAPEIPEEPVPPVTDTSKIKNMYIDNNTNKNLVIELKCDEKQKYSVPKEYDKNKYEFDQVRDRLIVKGLKYFTEYNVTNTAQVFHNLDAEIVKRINEYTVNEFKAYAEGTNTQQKCKDLIAKGLRANGSSFSVNLIKSLEVTPNNNSETKATLKITFDDDFKKYKTNDNEQYPINHTKSTMEIGLDFFKQVEINNLQTNIQSFVYSETGEKYTVDEFSKKINNESTNQNNELINRIKELVQNSVHNSKDVTNFKYTKNTNELTFDVTIQKYEKFPESGPDITYNFISKDSDGNSKYKVTITNLGYWFNFEFSNDELLKTWNEVQKIIGNNSIDLASEDNNESYNKDKQQIFDAISRTKLTNEKPISEYIKLNDTNVTRNNTDFDIDLSSLFGGNLKIKDWKNNDDVNKKFEFNKENDQKLKLNNFVFGTSLDCFVIDQKKRWLTGLTNLGKTKEILRLPTPSTANYNKVKPTDKSFFNLTSLKKVFIPEGVEVIGNLSRADQGDTTTRDSNWLFYNATNLEYIKLPKSLKKILNSFENTYKLKTIDFTGNDNQYYYSQPDGYDFGIPQNDPNYCYIAGSFECSGSEVLENIIYPKQFQWVLYNLLKVNTTSNTKYNGKIKYAIIDSPHFGNGLMENQKQLKAICILSESIKFINNLNSATPKVFPFNKNWYAPNAKIYVVNEESKKEIEKAIPNASIRPTIEVISDLKQQLIDAGKLPSNW